MTAKEQKKAAADFAAKWVGKGYEKGECQKFWRGLGQTPWSASFRIASAYFGSLQFASIALRDPSRARCPTMKVQRNVRPS